MAWRITALVRDKRGHRTEYLIIVGQRNPALGKVGAETQVKKRLKTIGYTFLNWLGASRV